MLSAGRRGEQPSRARFNRRRLVVGAVAAAAATHPLIALGSTRPLVGFAYAGRETDPLAPRWVAAFAAGLAGRGWRKDDNVVVEIRYSAGDPSVIPKVAEELVRLEPTVLRVVATPNTAAVLQRTRTIPVVFVQVSDPVGSGFVETLAQPGHNATGFTNFEASMAGRWLELLTKLAPATATVGALYNPEAAVRRGRFFVEPTEQAAARSGLTVKPIEVRSEAEIATGISELGSLRNAGLVVIPDTYTNAHRHAITTAALQAGIPAVYWGRQFVDAGGLTSYGIDIADHFRAGGDYVGRILSGASPADLPVQAASKFELVVNLRTPAAKASPCHRLCWRRRQR